MDKYPNVNAVFINAIIKSICEEGTKQEACDYLQEQWNEVCVLRDEVTYLRAALATAQAVALERAAQVADEWSVSILHDRGDTMPTAHAEVIARSVSPNIAAAIRAMKPNGGQQ